MAVFGADGSRIASTGRACWALRSSASAVRSTCCGSAQMRQQPNPISKTPSAILGRLSAAASTLPHVQHRKAAELATRAARGALQGY